MSCLFQDRHDPLHLIHIGSPHRLSCAIPAPLSSHFCAIAFQFFAISSTEQWRVPPRLIYTARLLRSRRWQSATVAGAMASTRSIRQRAGREREYAFSASACGLTHRALCFKSPPGVDLEATSNVGLVRAPRTKLCSCVRVCVCGRSGGWMGGRLCLCLFVFVCKGQNTHTLSHTHTSMHINQTRPRCTCPPITARNCSGRADRCQG